MRLPALLAAVLLVACEPAGPPRESPVPAPAPRSVPADPPPGLREDVARDYARQERRLVAQGLLRRDGGGIDTRYGADDLARNFEEIAFRSELRVDEGGYFTGAAARERGLTRWRGPVRIQLHFGGAVPPERRAADARVVAAYAARLARVTGHPVSVVPGGGNFHVHVAALEARASLDATLRRALPPDGYARAASIAAQGPRVQCAVVIWPTRADRSVPGVAVVLLRDELPPLSRLACFHEEIAQGLGLGNDSDTARPSIFNEDDEFATLTTHDEQLLRMLYDPRLSPGMTAAQARPTVQRIAAELVGAGAS